MQTKPATRINLLCLTCKQVFQVHPFRLWTAQFCSRSCQVGGQVWTPERKAKIGAATRGLRQATRGEKNYNWKGGSPHSVSRMARERDNDTCQCTSSCSWHIGAKCGFSDPFVMHVDHVKPKKLYPDLRYDLNNLLTVCPNCHQHKTNSERRAKIFS